MAQTIGLDSLAEVVMQSLTDYADIATDEMKSAVKKAAKTVQEEIKANAPKPCWIATAFFMRSPRFGSRARGCTRFCINLNWRDSHDP